MKKPVLYFFLLLVFSPFASYSQTSEKEEEMATVYFVRVSKYATHAMYYLFEEDSLININEDINWFKYECEPGDRLFWITNRKYTDFVPSEVEAGKSYIMMIDVNVGYGKTSTRLRPLTNKDKDFERAILLISETDSASTSSEDLYYKTKSLNKRDIIKKYLSHYYKDWRWTRKYKYIDYSFEIPEEYFNIKT